MTDDEKKPQHCEKELAQFIRTGANRRPDQAFGDYYRGRNASCALGAAYEGIYRLPEEVGKVRPQRLDRLFDCLEGTIRRCPEGCKKSLILAAMIIHLNDGHQWDRERIAAWVQGTVDLEPTPEPKPEGSAPA